eukprot:315544_1
MSTPAQRGRPKKGKFPYTKRRSTIGRLHKTYCSPIRKISMRVRYYEKLNAISHTVIAGLKEEMHRKDVQISQQENTNNEDKENIFQILGGWTQRLANMGYNIPSMYDIACICKWFMAIPNHYLLPQKR